MSNFIDLIPPEMLEYIFSFILLHNQLSILTRVCKKWNIIIDNSKRGEKWNILMYSKNSLNRALYNSSIFGYKDLIDFFITKEGIDINWGLRGAASTNHKGLVEFFIEKGANDWNQGLFGAAASNQKNLMNFFIEKGASDMNAGLCGGAMAGLRDVCDYFISLGANNFDMAIKYADIYKNNKNIENIKEYLEKKKKDMNEI